MNDVLAKVIDTHCPKFNKAVTEGVSNLILRTVPEYLDNIFKSSIKSLSPDVQLVYKGYRRLTPEEEFNELILSTGNKTVFDLAPSDLYSVEFVFDYAGEEIRRKLYLPFSSRGNLIRISNTVYTIVPILSDTVISLSATEVFVRLLKDKITFKSKVLGFVLNNEKVTGNVIYAEIVKTTNTDIEDNIGNPLTSVSLYPLGKYGFAKSMELYARTDKWIVTVENVDHLRNEYDVYESTKIKPRRLKDIGYKGHDVKILVHKSVPTSKFLEHFIYGIIYTLDLLPEQGVDFVYYVNNKNLKDEIFYWRVLLGKISYKNSVRMEKIVEDMTEHFITLEGYMDNLIIEKLNRNKIFVPGKPPRSIENFYDLIAVIMGNYSQWLLKFKEYNSNVNNRYIDILYYILYDIIIGFNKVILNLNRRATKKANLSSKEIRKLFNNEFSFRKIFTLVKASQQNLCMQVTESTSDIMYPKITAILEDQSRGNGVRRATKLQIPENVLTLNGYDLYLGSLLFLTKAVPSPRFRSNLYMQYNISTGKLIVPDDIQKTINKLETLLKGRTDNTKIQLLDSDIDID